MKLQHFRALNSVLPQVLAPSGQPDGPEYRHRNGGVPLDRHIGSDGGIQRHADSAQNRAVARRAPVSVTRRASEARAAGLGFRACVGSV